MCKHFPLFLVFPSAFRVHGKPAFADAVVLLVQFQDAPEAGEGDDTEDDAQVLIGDEEGGHKGGNAGQQERWPALTTEVVFGLDDQGMEHADAEEGGKADEETVPVHSSQFIVGLRVRT